MLRDKNQEWMLYFSIYGKKYIFSFDLLIGGSKLVRFFKSSHFCIPGMNLGKGVLIILYIQFASFIFILNNKIFYNFILNTL